MRLARRCAVLAMAWVPLAGAGAARAQAFAYAPGEHQYRLTSTISRTQRVGEQRATDSAVSVQVITLALAAQAKDTLRFAYTIDSAWATVAAAAQVLSGMRGKTVSGTMSPRGEVFTFQAPADSTSPTRGQEYQSLRSFLIAFPDAALRAGLSWTDTVTTAFSSQGLGGTDTTILTSLVLGDTVIGGEPAWRVERIGIVRLSGSGTQHGDALVLEGDRSTAGESYFSRSGVYLGSVSTQAGVTLLGARGSGRTLIVTQSATTKIERIARAER